MWSKNNGPWFVVFEHVCQYFHFFSVISDGEDNRNGRDLRFHKVNVVLVKFQL